MSETFFKIILRFLLPLIIICNSKGFVFGQTDAQYTQFYANSLYLSPSFAGSTETSRAFVAGRLQWPGIKGVRKSGTVSFDHYFFRYKSGAGILVSQNFIPGAQLSTLDIGIQYSYHLELSNNIRLLPGIQVGMGRRAIGANNLKFNEQYTDQDGYNPSLSSGENYLKDRINFYPDIASSLLLLSSRAWLGISAHHMNRPVESYTGDDRNKISMKASVHGGLKFYLSDTTEEQKEKSISPAIQYRAQGKWDQLDLGIYSVYDHLMVGLWYRGLPAKVLKGERFNNESVNVLLGLSFNQLNVGYSYDITISKLTNKSGGAHELTLAYVWAKPKKRVYKARRAVLPQL